MKMTSTCTKEMTYAFTDCSKQMKSKNRVALSYSPFLLQKLLLTFTTCLLGARHWCRTFPYTILLNLPDTQTCEGSTTVISFYRWPHPSTEKVNHWPKITQLLGRRGFKPRQPNSKLKLLPQASSKHVIHICVEFTPYNYLIYDLYSQIHILKMHTTKIYSLFPFIQLVKVWLGTGDRL